MAATNTSSTSETYEEYEIWYDAVDGNRRHMKALDAKGVEDVIASLHNDEKQRQLLASTVGLTIPDHQFNVGVLHITTTTEEVALS